MPQVTLLGEIRVTNDSIFMFTYPTSQQQEGSAQPLSEAQFFPLFSSFFKLSLLFCLDAVVLEQLLVAFFCLAPFFYILSVILFLCSVMSLCLYPEAKCPAVFPGQPAPSISSGSVSLCTFSLVMLSDQEISHSIRLKRSRSADKARAEGAPSPRSSICWLRLAPLLINSGHLHLSLCFFLYPLSLYLLAPSLKLVLSLSSSLNYQNYILVSFCSPTASHSALIRLSPTNAPSDSAFIQHQELKI